MDRETDTMITNSVFFEVVSAYLLRSIARTNHRTTFTGQRFVLLLFFDFL